MEACKENIENQNLRAAQEELITGLTDGNKLQEAKIL
jgi:hypothetical protein